MTQIRAVVFLAAAFCLIGSALSLRKSHDLITGRHGEYDSLLYSKVIHVPAKRSGIVEKEIEYSSPIYYRTPAIYIHYIGIQDLKKDGTGAYPTILSGGIGDTKVKIGFQSQKNRGIYFRVTMYGSIHKDIH